MRDQRQIYKNSWRFPFKPDGRIDSSDARCAWEELTNELGVDLYPPTSLLMLGPAVAERYRGNWKATELGNPAVGRELLAYLTLRDRFR